MSRRFFANNPIGGERFLLDGPEAHHLINVMRASAGDQVILFDGSGHEFDGIIQEIARKQVSIGITGKRLVDRELPFQLTMGVSLPKGERQKMLIEKLVEVGTTSLVPLLADRGVAKPEKNVVARLERTVVEASKQCGRNVLMSIEAPRRCVEFFEQSPGQATRLLALPDASAAISSVVAERARTSQDKHFLCAVGPEGGFTESEIESATGHGWQPVNLGQRILRAETAAIVMAGYLGLSYGSRATEAG